MSFNGIEADTSVPGEIPWEFVAVYFAAALLIAFVLGGRNGGLRKFSTMDLVYIGVGAALSVVWGFYIGAFIQRAIPTVVGNFIGVGPLGKLFIAFITAGLVRKVGAGILLYAVFNILSDVFFYGFGGEPFFTLYEALTYGLFLDMTIAITGGNIFGMKGRPQAMVAKGASVVAQGATAVATMVAQGASAAVQATSAAAGVQTATVKKSMLSTRNLAIIEGAILGLLWAFPSPLLASGFFNPFVYGTVVNWTKIIFNIYSFMPADVIGGILAALAAVRIGRAV